MDAVETGDLVSGKERARADRKALTNRTQALLDKVEAKRGEME